MKLTRDVNERYYENLQAPQRRPSVSIFRTAFSISFISVSSSQGFTSRMILDLAIKVGSAEHKSINDNVLRTTELRYILLDFLAAYAASRSSLILAASASSPYRIKCSKNFHPKR